MKSLHTEIERETKFNPISSSLTIISRAEQKGKRHQDAIDETVARYNELIEREKKRDQVYESKPLKISPY